MQYWSIIRRTLSRDFHVPESSRPLITRVLLYNLSCLYHAVQGDSHGWSCKEVPAKMVCSTPSKDLTVPHQTKGQDLVPCPGYRGSTYFQVIETCRPKSSIASSPPEVFFFFFFLLSPLLLATFCSGQMPFILLVRLFWPIW